MSKRQKATRPDVTQPALPGLTDAQTESSTPLLDVQSQSTDPSTTTSREPDPQDALSVPDPQASLRTEVEDEEAEAHERSTKLLTGRRLEASSSQRLHDPASSPRVTLSVLLSLMPLLESVHDAWLDEQNRKRSGP